ncbi:PREDICTED: macrophage migration inhibitory factor isoform X2 [Thamnophis sirtalis]|uniref:Macrophage migration inhibitory factor n=1 Tax=Thamnophis sirtalis TaxID=35019 RepID=A0A6I9XU98_9SAUR|nr:PREDICTED: macrophage migration inhibitory factor isoform X2 [Thamnophis sirtalis]
MGGFGRVAHSQPLPRKEAMASRFPSVPPPHIPSGPSLGCFLVFPLPTLLEELFPQEGRLWKFSIVAQGLFSLAGGGAGAAPPIGGGTKRKEEEEEALGAWSAQQHLPAAASPPLLLPAMPAFVVSTNVSRDALPEGLLPELTEELAKATGKPAQYVSVQVNPDQVMSFGGSSAPCAICSLHSIGKISAPQNKAYSAILSALLAKRLHVPADRVYINFYDMAPANVGWNGSTFA